MMTTNKMLSTRSAMIGGVSITSVASAATVQFGDRHSSYSSTRALAIQQKMKNKPKLEFDFSEFPFFNVSLQPNYPPNNICFHRTCHDHNIRVGYVHIIAASTASTILTGNSHQYNADARVKHFRVLS